jgi:ATP-binding cassette, subfamily B, bacterial PglK
MNIVIETWRLLDRRQRRRLAALQLLSMLMALFTVGGIAAVLPFFTVLADPGAIDRSVLLHWAYGHLRFAAEREFVITLGIGFIVVIVLANLVNLLGSLVMNRFAYEVGDGFHVALFGEYLRRGYHFHSTTNSSTLASNVIYESARITGGILQNGLTFITNLVTILFIVASITAVNPQVALAAAAGLGASYAVMYLFVRGKLLRNGLVESRHYRQRTRTVSEGFGAIKEIIVSQAQHLFVEQFAECCTLISRAVLSTLAVSQSPRYILECATICTLVGVALYLSGGSTGAAPWIAQLSFFGLAAYRLMPALHQAFSSLVKIRAERSAFMSVAGDLQQARARADAAIVPAADRCWRGGPQREIRAAAIFFHHMKDGRAAIAGLTLQIQAGTMVGFIGANGSGKTTLVDLLSGLLVPSAGHVEIDGLALDDVNRGSWLSNIAYVPQSIFLCDATVAENIALGVPHAQIDLTRVRRVARLARLDECVAGFANGYDERLGERGARLSGGQRQRLGIARALYRDAPVLIMDEATSSLDAASERDICDMLAACRPGRTMLVVAHRLNALRHCDVIHELQDGRINRSGTYQHMVARCGDYGQTLEESAHGAMKSPVVLEWEAKESLDEARRLAAHSG